MKPEEKAALLEALRTMPNRWHVEARLQREVFNLLYCHPVGFMREYRFHPPGQDRVDFALWTGPVQSSDQPPTLGIECKTAGSALSIRRQLYRYARHLPELVLLSAKATGIEAGIITAENGNKCLLHVFELWKNPT